VRNRNTLGATWRMIAHFTNRRDGSRVHSIGARLMNFITSLRAAISDLIRLRLQATEDCDSFLCSVTTVRYPHNARTTEACHSWDVHHRRICISRFCGDTNRSRSTTSGRVHLSISTRSPAYIPLFSPLQIGGGTYTNVGARIW
jgi:hypothetical protein